jgi:hypothetical protein
MVEADARSQHLQVFYAITFYSIVAKRFIVQIHVRSKKFMEAINFCIYQKLVETPLTDLRLMRFVWMNLLEA